MRGGDGLEFDKDLRSIQEVRNLVARAVEAQRQLSELSQEADRPHLPGGGRGLRRPAERLAKLAVEETGFGVWQDKVLKNLLGSTMTWEAMKDLKTVGILREQPEKGIWEVGVPVGVVAALIPSTTPPPPPCTRPSSPSRPATLSSSAPTPTPRTASWRPTRSSSRRPRRRAVPTGWSSASPPPACRAPTPCSSTGPWG